MPGSDHFTLPIGGAYITNRYMVRLVGIDVSDHAVPMNLVDETGKAIMTTLRREIAEFEQPMTQYGAPECTRSKFTK